MEEFSVYVPPALQYGSRFHSTFDNFEFLLYPKIIGNQAVELVELFCPLSYPSNVG